MHKFITIFILFAGSSAAFAAPDHRMRYLFESKISNANCLIPAGSKKLPACLAALRSLGFAESNFGPNPNINQIRDQFITNQNCSEDLVNALDAYYKSLHDAYSSLHFEESIIDFGPSFSLDKNVLRIHHFLDPEMPKELDALIQNLDLTQPLYLDLRKNPGGSLAILNEVLGAFLENGEVMYFEQEIAFDDASEAIPCAVLSKSPYRWDVSLAGIFVDQNTASAAEVMAGSLSELLSVPVYGEKTYGKWRKQVIEPYAVVGQRRLNLSRSTHQLFTPNQVSYERIGLRPQEPLPATY